MLPARLTGYLRTLREGNPSPDAALLARFAEGRDAEAFELLVWRHGALVLGICRRILRDHHAAEDAFQATFLILSRRAGSIRGPLPPWLHSVARRICLRSLRHRMQSLPDDVSSPCEIPSFETREILAVLDAEIARLPEKHRRVIVLCYLQNLTAEVAARELGIPRGTVLSRLDAARRKLQEALGRRGIAPVAILTVTLGHAVPSAALVRTAQQAALAFTAGSASTLITQLAIEVLHMTTRKWIAGTALGVIALAFASTGVGLLTANGPVGSQAVAQAPATPKPADGPESKTKKDQSIQLQRTEAELMTRIGLIADLAAKEKGKRGAGISPSALQQAIDKIDLEVLAKEEKLVIDRAKLEDIQKLLRPAKDYPMKFPEYKDIFVANERFSLGGSGPGAGGGGRGSSGGWGSIILAQSSVTLDTFPELAAYVNEVDKLNAEGQKLRSSLSADSPKYVEYLVKRTKVIESFKADVFPMIQMKAVKMAQEQQHSQIQMEIEQALRVVKSTEEYPNRVAKRRAELVKRLHETTNVSEEQKMLDDELQVLREFRKAVLKQKLTLKLEIDGVTLPAEPKK